MDSWEGSTALNVPIHSSTPRPVTLKTMKQFKKRALISEEHILTLFFFFFPVILGRICCQGSLCTAVARVQNQHCVIFEAAIAEQSGMLRAVSVQQHRSGPGWGQDGWGW